MNETLEPTIHSDLEPLAFLLGTWRGPGKGKFHSVDPFEYEEEVQFTHRGGPWLVYEQRAWSPEDGSLLHTEMGFWRMVAPGKINLFVSLTAGSDFSEGALSGTSISAEATAAPMADGIEPVEKLTRSYTVEGDTLKYEIWLGTDQQPYDSHVGALLQRV